MIPVGMSATTAFGKVCSLALRATLHGCRLGGDRLIDTGATIMDGTVAGPGSCGTGHVTVAKSSSNPPNSVLEAVYVKDVSKRDNTRTKLSNASIYSGFAQAKKQTRNVIFEQNKLLKAKSNSEVA